MTYEINHHLRVFIPKLDQFTDHDGRFVQIVKCLRAITGIGLVDAKGIVDDDNKWHNVPTKIKSQWQVDRQDKSLDDLYMLGCRAWIEMETPYTDQSWVKEATPTVEQDYMDTLGSILRNATSKEEVTSKEEADTIVDLKHYILMAINLKQYKMAKYLIDNLAQYEEGK